MDQHSTRTGPAPSELSDLPPEILERIFAYLSTNERKPVKLVCKSWFEVCNLPSVSKDEVLFCAGIYPLSGMYELLDRSERNFFDLKFNRVEFNEDSTFWKNNGPKIRSIAFERCVFYRNYLKEIIICCDNLVQLSFVYCQPGPKPQLKSALPMAENTVFFKDLLEVVENGIVRDKLHSLEVESSWHFTHDYQTLKQLFLIFPRLRALSIVDNIMDEATFTAALNDLMVYTGQIEKLKLCLNFVKFSADTLHYFTKMLVTWNKLTEFSTSMGGVSKSEVIEKFLLSKPFKSLVCKGRLTSTELFLLQLLQVSPDLEHVEISTPDNLTFTKDLLQKLMTSGLKSCTLDVVGRILVEDVGFLGSYFSTANRRTTSPSLSVTTCQRMESSDSMVPFLQYFQNLSRIDFGFISNAELQTLLKYQTKLKSLTLGHIVARDRDQIAVPRDAFNKLTDLEHLELGYSFPRLFLKSLTPQSIFANLKYLHFEHSNWTDSSGGIKEFPRDLSLLADAAPFLETIDISICGHHQFDVLQLCTKLCRLRFLRLYSYMLAVDSSSFTDEFYQKLFSICPSLRVLFHAASIFDRPSARQFANTYFFDVLNEKVTRVEGSSEWAKISDRIFHRQGTSSISKTS